MFLHDTVLLHQVLSTKLCFGNQVLFSYAVLEYPLYMRLCIKPTFHTIILITSYEVVVSLPVFLHCS